MPHKAVKHEFFYPKSTFNNRCYIQIAIGSWCYKGSAISSTLSVKNSMNLRDDL